MLSRRFFNIAINKNFNSINKSLSRFFTFKTEGLKNVLNAELKYEKENYSPVDANEIKEFKNSTKFEFAETENKIKMELRKKEGNYEIIVNFNARAPFNEEEQEQQDPEKDPENFVEFNVRIKKLGQSNGLISDCISFNNNLEITSVTYSEDVDKTYSNYQSSQEYIGPEFSTLDEKLQSEFTEFFSSLGINDELTNFIQVFCYDKDQRLYQNWLNEVNKFI